LATYLEDAINECCRDLPHDLAYSNISNFFSSLTSHRTKYLTQLLDGTFTYFALTVDQFTSTYLREGISPLTLFIDTNVIFGLLGLSDTALNNASRELIEAIKKHRLPFTLYYHEQTLRELRKVIGSAADEVKGKRWSQAMSRAAISARVADGIGYRFHLLNSETPTDPDAFFAKYEHITELLSDYGFSIYRTAHSTTLDEQRHQLIAEYEDFFSTYRMKWVKKYEAVDHDMAVWQTVKRLSKKSSLAFGAGAYFITSDYYLYKFDWHHLRERGSLGAVVMVNQFLQLLRPFIPSDSELDESFIQTFAIPEFRTMVRNYSSTAVKALSYLNAFGDVSERTAVKILTDEVLSQQLRSVEDNSAEFNLLIDSAIARDNQLLQEQAEVLKAGTQAARDEVRLKEEALRRVESEKAAAHNAVKEAQRRADEIEKRAVEAESKIEAVRAKAVETANYHGQSIARLQNQLDRYMLIGRIVSGSLFAVASILLVLLIPKFIVWRWLEEHPNKLGLYACTIAFLCGVGWIIADAKRRKYALVSLLLPALFVLFQIIGR
jgi:hypothetical protein